MKRFWTLLFILYFPLHSESAAKVKYVKNIILEYTVQHSFKKVTGICKSPNIEGLEIELRESGYEVSKPFLISCELKNLNSGNTNRDSHALEVLNYPKEVSFQVQVLKTDRKNKNYTFDTKLVLNGITEHKEIQATLRKADNGSSVLDGDFSIFLSKFKIERPALLFISIQDEVSIRFQVILE